MQLEDFVEPLQAVQVGANVPFESVCKDSRQVVKGALYVALKGESFDGHQFCKQAVERGAVALLVSDKAAIPKGVSALVVEDTVVALGQMAHHHRQQFKVPCVAVTGSCGKTTVRSMIAQILQGVGKTLSPEANYNNHIGLPMTLMRLDDSYEYLVLEMGANAMGDIATLCQMAEPDVTTITNIHPAHLEGFGSLEGVLTAKTDIFKGLAKAGIGVFDNSSEHAQHWRLALKDKQTLSFGNATSDVFATDIQVGAKGSAFVLHTPKGKVSIRLQVPGQHQIDNAITACACVLALGIEFKAIQLGLQSFSGVAGRMQVTQLANGTTVIDDTYNANPGSVKAAMDYLQAGEGAKILALGDMGELGENKEQWHAQMGTQAKSLGIDQLVTVGPLTKHTVEAFGQTALWCRTQSSMVEALEKAPPGSTILVKGSRAAKMEQVVQALIAKKGNEKCS